MAQVCLVERLTEASDFKGSVVSWVVLGALLFTLPALSTAAQYYVAADADGNGDGSQQHPWSIETALSQPDILKPGDFVWMRGGTYKGFFISKITGDDSAPIIVKQFPGER